MFVWMHVFECVWKSQPSKISRTYPRRRWICRPQRVSRLGDCSDQVDRHRQQACRRRQGEDRPNLRRRWWCRKSRRDGWTPEFQEELGCTQSSPTVFEGGSQIHLPGGGGQPARRFSWQSCQCRGTSSSRDHSLWLAHEPQQDSELPAAREVVLGSGRSLGRFDGWKGRRSKSPLCFDDVRSGPSCYRQWQLADVDSCLVGASTTIPAVCQPHSAQYCRSAVLGSLRPEVGRDLPDAAQRDRLLCGHQEETGEQEFARQERQGGGESRQSSSCCRQGQEESGKSRTSPCTEIRGLRRRRRSVKFQEVEGSLQAGEDPGQETSQPLPIRIPGAAAPVVSGQGLFHSLMRSLFRSGCRLGYFAKSFAAQRFHDHTGQTAEACLFPMPLPYPEVFKKRAASGDEGVALKKFVVMAVIVLNYLHLHRPRTISSALRPQQRLGKRQWEGVRVLESYARAWIEVSPIGPEEMGRTAAKVESMEEVIIQLETIAAHISGHNNYFHEPGREDQEGDPKRSQGRISSRVEQGGMTTFKEIDSKRLSFVGRPSFDPTPYLDTRSQKIFQDPLSTRDSIGPNTRKPPRLRVHCPKSEKIRLFQLLDSTDRLAIHRAEEVTPLYGSGLFSVTKSLTKDRMILDSRGANVLETPPNRWIKSLASAEVICRYQLLPHEELVTSGNDLKDFYYFFKSTSSRSRRNVLVGAIDPRELSHLRALKPEHHREDCVFGALKTLAMGDCQAVELAQSCHLGLAVSAGIVQEEGLVSLMKPPPRVATTVGLVIDDFVTLSRRTRGAEGPSEGAEKADEMLESYEKVGLMPNREKSFRDEIKSSFWGADVDGARGHVRGSLKRALPLSYLIIKLVNVGYGTVDLLQTVTGCIISLFLFRRRFLAVLDSLFESYRGRKRREVIELSGRVKSDLLLIAVLLPLAVSNLRSKPPDRIYASDASSWGEAAVHAEIPLRIGAELARHALRRSIWVRLLAPAAAWERSHGALTEGEEVPETEEPYQSNPLWETLARCLNYQLTFAKVKQAQRHINVGEVRGALKAERLGALRRPSSKLLLGLDSQVGLGALIKGRSASPALNAELSRSATYGSAGL